MYLASKAILSVLEHSWCIKGTEAKVSGLSLSRNVLASSLKEGFMAKKTQGAPILNMRGFSKCFQLSPWDMGRLGSTKGKVIKFLGFEIHRI